MQNISFINHKAWLGKVKVQSAVSDSRFMCLLSDGSADSGLVEQETVYVRYMYVNQEVSFVTLHMQWHKGCCSNSIHKNEMQDHFSHSLILY